MKLVLVTMSLGLGFVVSLFAWYYNPCYWHPWPDVTQIQTSYLYCQDRAGRTAFQIVPVVFGLVTSAIAYSGFNKIISSDAKAVSSG